MTIADEIQRFSRKIKKYALQHNVSPEEKLTTKQVDLLIQASKLLEAFYTSKDCDQSAGARA